MCNFLIIFSNHLGENFISQFYIMWNFRNTLTNFELAIFVLLLISPQGVVIHEWEKLKVPYFRNPK